VAAAAVIAAALPAVAEDATDAGSPAAAQDAPPAGRVWASCTEHIPQGASRPQIAELFPIRGTSGYATALAVTVTHGKGETVLPEGFRIQRGTDAFRALEGAGFIIPEPDGGAGPSIAVEHGTASSTTKLAIPFVPLPKEPGRNVMVLPPIPIAVARASGEQLTLCTEPHTITVEDPIANEADPKVRPNPDPQPQREEWVLAKQLSAGLLAGAVLGLIGGWIALRLLRRPKPVPVIPPKLPWVAALEELEQIRRSSLLIEARTDEYFDRVSGCVRNYLGARYGFDGLETTTDEMRSLLSRVRPTVRELPRIMEFLADCDLVKFARVVPAEKDCLEALERGELIVRHTIPPAQRPGAWQSAAGPQSKTRQPPASAPPAGAA
jgi:hypothetical protein